MRLGSHATLGDPPLRLAMRLAWLVVALVVIGKHFDRHPLKLVVLAVAVVAWLDWQHERRRGHALGAATALLVLGLAGGLLPLWSSVAIGFLAAAGVAAGSAYELVPALGFAAIGPVVLTTATLASGHSGWLAFAGAAAALAGLVGGIARRQTEERTTQAALLSVASDRANVLAERNRIAREVHDVLAHTLGAVAVQLEAAHAVNDGGGDPNKLRELLDRSRKLVAEGLDETSRAVHALRDEPVELDRRLADLVAGEHIGLEVRGTPRPLAPDAGIALYRAAQEAITNVRKYAPGAATRPC